MTVLEYLALWAVLSLPLQVLGVLRIIYLWNRYRVVTQILRHPDQREQLVRDFLVAEGNDPETVDKVLKDGWP